MTISVKGVFGRYLDIKQGLGKVPFLQRVRMSYRVNIVFVITEFGRGIC